jgi:hypothetical protein
MEVGNVEKLNDVWSDMPIIVTHEENGPDKNKQALTVKTILKG